MTDLPYSMKIFRGYPRRTTEGGFLVTVETIPADGRGTYGEKALQPRLDIVNHSPSGFGWGYGGSGAGQLALAILADLYSPAYAQAHYMKFKWDCIAKLAQDAEWSLSDEQIRAFVPAHRPKHVIRFDHEYRKLHVLEEKGGRRRARLLQVVDIDAQQLTDGFVEYDATWDDVEGVPRRFPIPSRGGCLLLIFEGLRGIFTTIRTYTDEKAEYYRAATGAMFDVEIAEDEPSPSDQ